MDSTQGKSSKSSDAPKEHIGITEEQMKSIVSTVVEAAAGSAAVVARQAAIDYVAQARPEIESRTQEVAQKAVSEALARRQKTTAMKEHGKTAAISAAVFALGTLVHIGVDKFRHRNDKRANEMNPQYQAANM